MSSIDSLRGGPPPLLDAFRQSAEQGDSVRVQVDGQELRVLAQGELQGGSGTRSVSWVEGGVDTTAMFVDALGQAYGRGLSGALARELGLEPAPGKPLSSRQVSQALEMAETGRQALSGVDFLTALQHSAKSQGIGFQAVAAELGIAPQSLAPEVRARIDESMEARFSEAQAKGQSPVQADTVRGWLREELTGRHTS
jgi:hypothetical protein